MQYALVTIECTRHSPGKNSSLELERSLFVALENCDRVLSLKNVRYRKLICDEM